MKDHRVTSFILFILQVSLVIPTLQLSLVISQPNRLADDFFHPSFRIGYDVAVGFAFLFIALDHKFGLRHHTHFLPSCPTTKGPLINKRAAKKFALITIGSVVFLVIAHLHSYSSSIPQPGSPLLIVLMVPIWWVNASKIYHSRRRALLSRVGLIISIFLAGYLQIQLDKLAPIPLIYCWWVGPWVYATSFKTTGTTSTHAQPKKQGIILHSLHTLSIGCGAFLKFMFLIICPTIFWIKFTATSNSTPRFSSVLTFGQLFALFNSAIPAWTIIYLCLKNRQNMWCAVWMMEDLKEEFNEEDSIPMIAVIVPDVDMLEVPWADGARRHISRKTAYPQQFLSHDTDISTSTGT